MIWHFVEIWALLFVAFALGCTLGAAIYTMLARGSLAPAQGAVADAVGDVVDNIKSRLGVGPVWRPEYRHLVERPLHDADADTPRDDRLAEAGYPPDEAAAWSGSPQDDPPLLESPHDWQAEEVGEGEDEWSDTAATQAEDDASPTLAAEPADMAEEEPVVPERSEREATAPAAAPARPVVGLAAPRNGVPDNLQKINGIGARNEQLLNSLGIFHFGQIATLTPGEVKWIAEHLAFPERIERDDWIGQAMILATGGETGFSKSAERRRERRRRRDRDPVESEDR